LDGVATHEAVDGGEVGRRAVDLGSAGDDGLKVQHDHAFCGKLVQCASHGGVLSLVLLTKSVQVGQVPARG